MGQSERNRASDPISPPWGVVRRGPNTRGQERGGEAAGRSDGRERGGEAMSRSDGRERGSGSIRWPRARRQGGGSIRWPGARRRVDPMRSLRGLRVGFDRCVRVGGMLRTALAAAEGEQGIFSRRTNQTQ
eukprot:1574280-Pyramimonas_sp.AAC.1